VVPLAWPEELRKRLAIANDGAVELLPSGEPSPAELRRGQGLTGSSEVVRCGCA
jgi:hypothetical protein